MTMDVRAWAAAGAGLPAGVLRIEYRSAVDGRADWALAKPPERGGAWVVVIHGHGSHGDQVFVRPDVRDTWLPEVERHGLGLLSPNLRDDAWMSPAAAADLRDLLAEVRARFGARRFVLASGSMGGTSNLIYAALHPEDVAGVVALGAAVDLGPYVSWCRERGRPAVCAAIAGAIEEAYARDEGAFALHSPLRRAARLTMPVFLAHGERDALMPVEGARALAAAMRGREGFAYREVAEGDHDSPLWLMREGLEWVLAQNPRLAELPEDDATRLS